MGLDQGFEWEPFAAVNDATAFQGNLSRGPFCAKDHVDLTTTQSACMLLNLKPPRCLSRDGVWEILDGLSNGNNDLANRIVTTSPT